VSTLVPLPAPGPVPAQLNRAMPLLPPDVIVMV
jgi:hypothetical protein